MSRRAGIGMILAFSVLALVAHGEGTPQFDRDVSSWIRDHSAPAVGEPIEAAMRTGPVAIVAVVSAALLHSRGDRRGALLMILIVSVMLLSDALKTIVASPRPGGAEGDWGFPAGRAGNAVLLFGALANVLPVRNRAMRITSAAVPVLLVGWARVASGSQWASDVGGAWLWSIPALVVSLAAVRHLFPKNVAFRR